VDSDGGPFFRRKGSFQRRGARRVVRYQCKQCNKHFSEQTFAEDYREKRPELLGEIARLLRAGYSQRASARLLGANRKTVARRARRLRAGLRTRSRSLPPA
jgi:transposase-like protein